MVLGVYQQIGIFLAARLSEGLLGIGAQCVSAAEPT